MPFIPHAQADIQSMLRTIGLQEISDLFTEVPDHLNIEVPADIPEALNEIEVSALMRERAQSNAQTLSFLGAGAYRHHVPHAVLDMLSRGEWLTAYTPYQAEASQGTLQLIYEYQTMMTRLMGMEVSNASLYDGATALVEAILMAVRIKKADKPRVLLASALHPWVSQTLMTQLTPLGIQVDTLPTDAETGCCDTEIQTGSAQDAFCALVLAQPNFWGMIEPVDAWVDWAHAQNALVIGYVNPMLMAWLKPPGQWGQCGADIACGEGQPLGLPLAGGGPYFGFLVTRRAHIRQLPGRLVARADDAKGQTGYVLTLQAREQHIRRSKATSNICTNQGVMLLAATMTVALLGAAGLRARAIRCHENCRKLVDLCCEHAEVTPMFKGPYAYECALKISGDIDLLHQALLDQGVYFGLPLQHDFKTVQPGVLVCATECHRAQDFEQLSLILQASLTKQVSI